MEAILSFIAQTSWVDYYSHGIFFISLLIGGVYYRALYESTLIRLLSLRQRMAMFLCREIGALCLAVSFYQLAMLLKAVLLTGEHYSPSKMLALYTLITVTGVAIYCGRAIGKSAKARTDAIHNLITADALNRYDAGKILKEMR